MSLGRGKMLQSVKQKAECDLRGRICQLHMADYTNESIEKFCRKLAEKGAEEYLKESMDSHSSGSNCDIKEVKIDTIDISQFDDADALGPVASSVTESMDSCAEGSESSSSLLSGVNEEETSSLKSFTSSNDDSNRNITKPQKYLQKQVPVSRLAVRWPETSTIPKPKIENVFPATSMGRGGKLQMVSASITKSNPQREIIMNYICPSCCISAFAASLVCRYKSFKPFFRQRHVIPPTEMKGLRAI